MSACRHGLTPCLYCRQPYWIYIRCRHVGMFLWQPQIFYTKISNEQYCGCRHVGMSACQHIFPPPLPSPHSLHTYLIYLFERFSDSGFLIVLIPPQIYSLDFKYNIGYWRHVGMSAWLDPPPILPTTKHDIHIVSACRHVFITTSNFLLENTKWAIVSLSACRHVGMSAYIPHLPPPHKTAYCRLVGMSACRHGFIPLLYWRQPNMTYIWCRHCGMFL